MTTAPQLRLLETQATIACLDARTPRYVKKAARGILKILHGLDWSMHVTRARVRLREGDPPVQARHLLRRSLEIALADGLPTATRNTAIHCAAAALLGVPPCPEIAPLIVEALELGALPGVRVTPLAARARAWGTMRGRVGAMIRHACRDATDAEALRAKASTVLPGPPAPLSDRRAQV